MLNNRCGICLERFEQSDMVRDSGRRPDGSALTATWHSIWSMKRRTKMDYKELTFRLINSVWKNPGMTDAQSLEWDAADAITDLLARAEEAEEEVSAMRKELWSEKTQRKFAELAWQVSSEHSIMWEGRDQEAKCRAETAEARAEKAERERDEAVKLCGKLMPLCCPPKELEPKLFRPCIKQPGDYMGSGYAFLDSFNRIFDEFTETADEETYRAIREAAEQESLDRTRRMIGQKEE